MIKKILIILIIVTLPLLVVSCGGEEDTGEEKFTPKIKKRAAKKAQTKQADKDKEEELQLGEGKEVNPFSNYLAKLTEKKRVRPKEPLECCSISELRLKLIVTGKGEPVAVIQDPSGKRHFARVGDYIGLNEGRIKSFERTVNENGSIVRSWIVITEPVLDEEGNKVDERNIEFALPDKE